MSLQQYKEHLSYYLTLYENAKKQDDLKAQLDCMNSIIQCTYSIISVCSPYEKGSYQQSLQRTMSIKAELEKKIATKISQQNNREGYGVPNSNQQTNPYCNQTYPTSFNPLPPAYNLNSMDPKTQYNGYPSVPLTNNSAASVVHQPARQGNNCALPSQLNTYNSLSASKYGKKPAMTGIDVYDTDYVDRPLTQRERNILRRTSTINGTVFLPWIESDAIDFNDVKVFEDPFDFQLKPTHLKRGGHFVNPVSLHSSPTVIKYPIDPFCVQQNNVGDCTIVSSIISCANYEARFKKPIVSSILFPQCNGLPVYNPKGRYIVKLYFNGVPRKVIVDHRVLVDRENAIMSVHSTNPGELWPILIEKGFLKVHGGYSYAGGNGGQDTYSITGWIPENFPFTDDPNDKIWGRLHSAFNYGDCIITAGSRTNLDCDCEEKLGLCNGHCYCITRLEEIDGQRLVQLRNPWGCVSWKGRYSYQDRSHWTMEMRDKLCSDYEYRSTHPDADDGLFWMAYEDVRMIHYSNVNWSPELLKSCITFHDCYSNTYLGKTKDNRNCYGCPQYILDLTNTFHDEIPVYVMVSRHYTEYEDMLGNDKRKVVMSVQIYEVDSPVLLTKGNDRIASTRKEFLFTNVPYEVARVNCSPGHHYYSVVLFELKEDTQNVADFDFSLLVRHYPAVQSIVRPATDYPNYYFSSRFAGKWSGQNSGGNTYADSYGNNPVYYLDVKRPTHLLAVLETINNSNICIAVRLMKKENIEMKVFRKKTTIEDSVYSSGVASIELDVQPGQYGLIVSSYDAGIIADYVVSFRSNIPLFVSESNIIPIALPEVDNTLVYNYIFSDLLMASTTGSSVLAKKGFHGTLRLVFRISSQTLAIFVMTVSNGSIPLIGLYRLQSQQDMPFCSFSNAICVSDMHNDASRGSTRSVCEPGFYALYYGILQSKSCDCQIKVFASAPIQFY